MWLLREKANSRSGAGSIPDKPETSLCIRKQSSFQGQPNYCIKVIPKKKKLKLTGVLSEGHRGAPSGQRWEK